MAESKFGHGQGMDEWSRNISDIMEEMRTRSFFDFRDSGTWQPATNMYETQDAYHICVDLAGVREEAVELRNVNAKQIRVVGRRRQPHPRGVEGPLSVHLMEIDQGPFDREIDFPDPVDFEARRVICDEGYLWITLPKKAKP